MPTKSCGSKLIKKWRTTGLVLIKQVITRKWVFTDEKIEDIQARLQISPWKSLKQLSKKMGVSVGSASEATKLIVLSIQSYSCA